MINLSNLPKTIFQTKKRVGRGEGSNRGKNSGKGHKGQNKHGQGVRIGFEGGQKTLLRRTPKFRGFKAMDRKNKAEINLGVLDKFFAENEVVSLLTLQSKGVVNQFIKKVRVINTGTLNKVLQFEEGGNLYLTKGVKSVLNK